MESGPSQAFTVISLNIAGLPRPPHAHARAAAFCRLVANTDADVINLQEVHGYGLLRHLRKDLREFPFASFKPGTFGPKAGLVTFSKTPVAKTELFSFFPATRALESSQRPGKTLVESLHKGVLVTYPVRSDLVIMNTHLNPNTDGDWSDSGRFHALHVSQLNALTAFAGQEVFRNAAVVISGDFNLAKDCDLFPAFIAQGGWTDVFEGDFTSTYNAEFLSPDQTPHCIDYLLLRDPVHTFTAHEASHVFTEKVRLGNNKASYISDHMGLCGRFSISRT